MRISEDSLQVPLFTEDFYVWKLEAAKTWGQRVAVTLE